MGVKFAKNELTLLSSAFVLPNKRVSNETLLTALGEHCGALAKRKARTIAKRLGVESRYLVRDLAEAKSQPSPSSIDLGVEVLTQVLGKANLDINELEYLLSHTCTPHTQVPPNAAWLADRLSFQGPYLELRQACTGFANALQIASAFCSIDEAPVAIVGIETGSVYFEIAKSFLTTEQLVNYVQMGDGAGAVILGPAKGEEGRLTDIYLGQIGEGKEPGFYLDSGSMDVGNGEMTRFHHNTEAVRANGSQLFELGLQAVLSRGYQLDDFTYILPHQANGHIDIMLAEALGIEPERIINDAKHFGNQGSAAIWVSFAKLVNSGRLLKGDKVLVLGAEATKYLYGGFVYCH
ncbi:3-oxoacyl-ACP synthase [Shewanella sp. D64]|uniref:3-oxoacyl-ACP synthase III family protein n=1 Tax=unclassified Shewanella TaxID=196818 RepID=UPI0022BA37BC|nr:MULTISPECIES: 3-oxoacyl-[acyl-carrier-protein] synthase III C-terminal domain-containing protein [unclassified Shewanella]MEC4726950.1 3-oxoacyl-ACP synthase [Shewanella sp. D64]MEC4738553.1 3-oxoacyl-ACP synthase [Shewanella sp. E94]WBJ93771.1 3-oxoacyl-ACP synthase [Shewanella sp. MTB7]